MPDTKDAIYFAGFFDGEGHVGMYAGGRNVVTLTNTDIRPLLRAQTIWGGSITSQDRSRQFAIRDLYRWTVYGHAARPFLEDVRPFLLLKGEQVDVYLATLAYVPVGRGTRRRPGDTEAQTAAAARLRLLKRGVA